MKPFLTLAMTAVLGALATPATAEVVSYHLGDTIALPCVVSPTPVPGSLRALVLMNETKLAVKGTWDANDCDVLLNGNTVRVQLKASHPIPIGILGNSGVYYYVVVQPAPATAGATLSPTVQVVSEPWQGGDASERSPQDRSDPLGAAGGSWENSTNSLLRLHKHIRGGRPLSTVAGHPEFNEQILKEEHRRVPGKVWTFSDDWKVLEYYSWTLESVTGHYIGVTYTGRRDTVDFNYLSQQTDRTMAIWHQRVEGDPQVWNMRYPTVLLHQGREDFFIVYTLDQP